MKLGDVSTVNVFGLEIAKSTRQQAVKVVIELVEQKGSHRVSKPYVEFVERATADESTRANLQKSDVILADSVAVQWAASYLQAGKYGFFNWVSSIAAIIFKPESIATVIPERLAGVNFTWPLLEAAAERGYKVMLVGSPKTGTIKDRERIIKERIPNITLVPSLVGRDESGEFSQSHEKLLRELIKKHRPDIVLLGIGFPAQEVVAERLKQSSNHGVFIGEGGTFDYESFGGQLKKAPKLFQHIGLEWLWRLFLEPKRISRQMAVPRFLWRVFRFSKTKK
ncbi:WecB/TagA/CpsF family glycosyltransferase [Candidatus Saccharibacteria bacterium]|nr:WecB/TagA/CpsF family glycosyltransferase [Candidatus Saccharibacteria bacterium]